MHQGFLSSHNAAGKSPLREPRSRGEGCRKPAALGEPDHPGRNPCRSEGLLASILTRPNCSHQTVETMPVDACQFFYDRKGCGTRLEPVARDRCVFCSYGSVPGPPIQENRNCCGQAN